MLRMSSEIETTAHDPGEGAEGPTIEGRRLPLWKKVLFAVASLFVVIGLVLLAVEPSGVGGDLSTSQSPGGMPEGATGFDATIGGQTSDQAPGESELGPVFLKLGFSFFVGFAVGYAFRAFLKLTLIFVGVLLIALFLLSYAQWVTVNWDTMARTFEMFVDAVQADAQAFQSFVTGSLPQAGLASLGLVAGFKRS